MLSSASPSNVPRFHSGRGLACQGLRTPRTVRRAHTVSTRMQLGEQDENDGMASEFSTDADDLNARLNAQHRARVKALQEEHADQLRILNEEHAVLKQELLLRISEVEKDSGIGNDTWEEAVETSVDEALSEVDVMKSENDPDEDDNNDFADEHLRSALDALFNPNATKHTNMRMESMQNGTPNTSEGQPLDPETMRRKIFAFEHLYLQKQRSYFHPEIDGMQTGNEAEIAALRKEFSEKVRKFKEIKSQLSEALSLLEQARDERSKLQEELDRRDILERQLSKDHFVKDVESEDRRSANNPRLLVFLEKLYSFSCDPNVIRMLERDEEERLWGMHDSDDAARD